ncbi:MAG: hypothetical protein R3Y09_02265 [Clostridia bacterium]
MNNNFRKVYDLGDDFIEKVAILTSLYANISVLDGEVYTNFAGKIYRYVPHTGEILVAAGSYDITDELIDILSDEVSFRYKIDEILHRKNVIWTNARMNFCDTINFATKNFKTVALDATYLKELFESSLEDSLLSMCLDLSQGYEEESFDDFKIDDSCFLYTREQEQQDKKLIMVEKISEMKKELIDLQKNLMEL